MVLRKRLQQRTAEKIGRCISISERDVLTGVIEVPETASQDRRLQHSVEQAFVDRVEAENAFQERIS